MTVAGTDLRLKGNTPKASEPDRKQTPRISTAHSPSRLQTAPEVTSIWVGLYPQSACVIAPAFYIAGMDA